MLTPTPGFRNIEVVVDGEDPDGHIVLVELDLDGNGDYELGEPIAPGDVAHVEKARIDPGLGRYTLRARLTDDAGAVAVLTTSLEIHADNLRPLVSVEVEPSAPRPGEPVTVSAIATRPRRGAAVRRVRPRRRRHV